MYFSSLAHGRPRKHLASRENLRWNKRQYHARTLTASILSTLWLIHNRRKSVSSATNPTDMVDSRDLG